MSWPPDSVALLFAGTVFLAVTLRAIFGFGDAVIAMPLLVMITDVRTAVPAFAVFGVSVSVLILIRDRAGVHVGDAWRLILSSLCGIPAGLWMLHALDATVVKLILAAGLIAFGIFELARPRAGDGSAVDPDEPERERPPMLRSDRWAYAFGAVSGILGGAYNTSGPPIVVFGVLRSWPPSVFRATLQGYFLPTGGMILIGHALGGLWTPRVGELVLVSVPAMFAGLLVGGAIHRRIPGERFRGLVYALLTVLGLGLAASVIR